MDEGRIGQRVKPIHPKGRRRIDQALPLSRADSRRRGRATRDCPLGTRGVVASVWPSYIALRYTMYRQWGAIESST